MEGYPLIYFTGHTPESIWLYVQFLIKSFFMEVNDPVVWVPLMVIVVCSLILINAFMLKKVGPNYVFERVVDFRYLPEGTTAAKVAWIQKQYEEVGAKCSIERANGILHGWEISESKKILEAYRKRLRDGDLRKAERDAKINLLKDKVMRPFRELRRRSKKRKRTPNMYY